MALQKERRVARPPSILSRSALWASAGGVGPAGVPAVGAASAC